MKVRLRCKDRKLERDPKVRAWLRECEKAIQKEVDVRRDELTFFEPTMFHFLNPSNGEKYGR